MYGQASEKFIVRAYDGGINGIGTSEDSPKEEVFDDEQEMLKRIYEIKIGLTESRWVIQDKELISQPSFLKTEIIDGAISFEFRVDIDPVKLDQRKMVLAQNFLEKIDKELETSIRERVDNKGG